MKKKTWEERFDEIWKMYSKGSNPVRETKDFIRSLLVEEVKRVMELVDDPHDYVSNGEKDWVWGYRESRKFWRSKKLQVLRDYENELKKEV